MTLDRNIADNLVAKLRASFFILLQNCTELMTADETIPPLFPDEQREVIRFAAGLDTPPGETERAVFTEALMKLRASLLTSFKHVNALKAYMNLTLPWLWWGQMRDCDQYPDVSEDGLELFGRHMELIFRNRDENDRQERDDDLMSIFMSLIPMRMASTRYSDYIKASFHTMDYNLGPDDAEDYKLLFFPMDAPIENGALHDMKQVLDALWDTDPVSLDVPTLNEGRKRIIDERKTLVKLTNHVCTLFDAVNALLILQQHDDYITALLREPETRSLYERFQSMQLGEDFNARLDKAVHTAVERARDFSVKGRKIALSAEEQAFALHVTDLEQEWLRVSRLFYESGLNFLQIPVQREVGIETEASTEDFLRVFLPYMEQRTAEIPPKKRRFMRQIFLQYLPYPYDFDTYKQYFIDVYESLDKAGRLLMTFFVITLDKIESEEADADSYF